jgi:addiction module HigA family antidote
MPERKMTPTHPGAILREDIIHEMKLSITEAAKSIGISRRQLSEVVNERAAVSSEMALRLEEAFGVEADFWLGLQKNYTLLPI